MKNKKVLTVWVQYQSKPGTLYQAQSAYKYSAPVEPMDKYYHIFSGKLEGLKYVVFT